MSSAGLRLSLLALQQGYLTPGTSGLSSPNFSISGNAMIQGTTAAGIAEVKALEVFNETMPPADVPTQAGFPRKVVWPEVPSVPNRTTK